MAKKKKLIHEKIFISPFEKYSESEALQVLDEIRKQFSAKDGWEEIDGYAELLENGKWRAVRKHVQYK